MRAPLTAGNHLNYVPAVHSSPDQTGLTTRKAEIPLCQPLTPLQALLLCASAYVNFVGLGIKQSKAIDMKWLNTKPAYSLPLSLSLSFAVCVCGLPAVYDWKCYAKCWQINYSACVCVCVRWPGLGNRCENHQHHLWQTNLCLLQREWIFHLKGNAIY